MHIHKRISFPLFICLARISFCSNPISKLATICNISPFSFHTPYAGTFIQTSKQMISPFLLRFLVYTGRKFGKNDKSGRESGIIQYSVIQILYILLCIKSCWYSTINVNTCVEMTIERNSSDESNSEPPNN